VNRTALLTLALVGTLSLAGCGKHQQARAAGEAAAPVQAQTETLSSTTVPVESESPGTVVSAHTVRVASRLSGFVDRVNVDLGDHVSRGQVLLTIDDRDVQAKVQQARSNVASAKAALADARFNYDRYRDLYKQGAASRQEYERIKRNFDTARAQLQAARAGLRAARAQRSYAQVHSPIAGVVTGRSVDPGDLAMPGKPLLTLQRPGNLQVHTNVRPGAFRALKQGGTVRVVAGSDSINARVIHIGPAASAGTETHPVKLALPPDTGLASGSFVQVMVPTGERHALLVPRTAVVHRAGIPGVFIVGKDGKAHLRLVRLGQVHGERVEIAAGLHAGERFVSAPGADVGNGTPIRSGGSANAQ